MKVSVSPRVPHLHANPVLSAVQQLDPAVQRAVVAELVRQGLLPDGIEDSPALHASRRAAGTAQVQQTHAAGQPRAAASAPMDRAQRTIANERARVEQEKYSFTDKQRADVDAFNAKRAQANAPHEAKLAQVDAQIAGVQADPALSPKARAEKLAKLNTQRAKIADKIKPPVVLEQVTAEVDAIASDDSLSQDQKKKKLEALRKKYGLPENKGFCGMNGPVNMHDLFTGRLGRINKESAKRIEAAGKAHKQELKAELAMIEATYGKDSPQAARAKQEIARVDQTYKAEHQRLKQMGDFLYDLYRPKSFFESLFGFFKKAFGWIGKIVDFVMPVVRLIPGVGQIAGAIWAGAKTVGNLVTGNFKGAISSLLEALPGVGGVVGKIAGYVQKGVNLVKSGVNTVRSLVRGDVGGALRGAAGVAGGAGAGEVAGVLGKGATAVDTATSLARGDVAGALGSASGLAGNGEVGRLLGQGAQVAGTVQRAASGDVLGALSQAGRQAGVSLPAPVQALQAEAERVRQRIERSYDEQLRQADAAVQQVFGTQELAQARQALGQVDETLAQQVLAGLYGLVPVK